MAEVIRPSSSRSVLLAEATFASVWMTHAGSLRFPRNGTGARYGESDSSRSLSSGTNRSSASSAHFLKVTIPLKDTYQPDSIANSASEWEPV